MLEEMNNISKNIIFEKNCCGCGACMVSCPKKCISMKEKTLGHKIPFVDANSCVNCGLCESVCPMLDSNMLKIENSQRAFAAFSNDRVVRSQGSSGAVFEVISNALLEKEYIIYGAAFDENLNLKCTAASNKEELSKLYKSKYLQSDLTNKFAEIKQKLINNEKILFVSTPCQVRALKLFLRENYDNLITIDFFCHGVPSQKFFDECIKVENNTQGGKVVEYQFRTKMKHGVTPHYYTEVIRGKNGLKKISGIYFKSPFYAFFQKYINLRESCYNCKFAGEKRWSDITIGDFHEIENYIDGVNRFDGVSTVVINSQEGQILWNMVEKDLVSFDVDLKRLKKDGVCFGNGTERPTKRDEFIGDYNNMSMEQLINKWVNPKLYLKQKIYYSLPKGIRKIIKKCVGE